MAEETKTRGRVWVHKETLLLLEKWGDENIQLQLKSCIGKKAIWLEIAAYLRAAGYEDMQRRRQLQDTNSHSDKRL